MLGSCVWASSQNFTTSNISIIFSNWQEDKECSRIHDYEFMMQDLVVIEGHKSSKRLCSLVGELLCHAKFDLLGRSLKEEFNIRPCLVPKNFAK
ncbi:hypothetical protein SORBI_3001G515200 [Sorghum bicolor]|uniref:Uncharacterized protein n=1 Tax=Sorghum bicolor TaxID=4558 RepID=A0A1B6QQP2_SORBI|nr:hypothetical protein SORBI_3001G515200 [Sorghum bicolor]